MKIVNVIGGLGNQMFQYAFAVALREAHSSEKIFVDTQHYKNAFIKEYHGNNFYHNGYEISKIFPNASINEAKARDIMKVSYYIPNQIIARFIRRLFPNRKTEFVADKEPYKFIPDALTIDKDCYYDGYWMSSKYFNAFREAILREFTFKPFDTHENIELMKLLMKENSVTIHVRRGDYLGTSTLGGICTLEYYRNAIRKAREIIDNPVFFVFSNDQEWCLSHLKEELGDAVVYFVNHNRGLDSYRDMQLMTFARCTILANSSFSWWGAYLNKRDNHFTLCPNKWHNQMNCDDHYVDGWIKINVK